MKIKKGTDESLYIRDAPNVRQPKLWISEKTE